MTHDELCERARRWLAGSRRCEPVFSNIASCSEIPDAIGWSSCWSWHGSTVVECKTSRGDFVADRRKYIGYRDAQANWNIPGHRMTEDRAASMGLALVHLPRMGDFRFFMCEPDAVSAGMVEKHAPDHGLIHVLGPRRVKIVRAALRREATMIDKDAEIRYLRFSIINAKLPFSLPEARSISLLNSDQQLTLESEKTA